MKKYFANIILFSIVITSLGIVIYQVGSPIVKAYKEHGLIGIFAALFVLIVIVAIGYAIIKLVNWAIENSDL